MAKVPPSPVTTRPRLDSLSLGFRNDYLDHQGITKQLQAWHTAYPDITRLRSLGKTPEGRDIWLLVVGTEPDRRRPAAWVDGNMHAVEVAGSSVALGIAEDMLRLHTAADSAEALGISAPLAARLRQVLLYVVPRISPDGAELVLHSGQFVRSVPRDSRVEQGATKWIPQDLDGDGLAMAMRVLDQGGELTESTVVPGLLVERTIDDAGPFYKLYPEGVIANFDGKNVPSPYFLGHAPVDLNRNFPWSWAPGHEQVGAGPFATSEPEARAIVEFATAHPEIFTWLNLHTFGGVAIRPLGHAPDAKMNQEDLAIFRQVEQWMTEFTGYPTVSGYDEFLYAPDKPLRGDLSDYAYNQRGALSYVIELWDLFARLDMPKPAKFVQYYDQLTRQHIESLALWDRDHNGGRIFVPWRPWHHPQLGAVEIGGIDPRIGLWNPSLAELPAVCASQSKAYLRVAAMVPQLQIGEIKKLAVGGNLVTRIEIRVENTGYLGTYGVPSAKPLDFNEPVYATLTTEHCHLLEPAQAHQVLGHLDGWGHGLHTGQNLPAYPQTRGTTNAAFISALIQGSGIVHIAVGSSRMGFLHHTVEV
jgi:hypothetical protein